MSENGRTTKRKSEKLKKTTLQTSAKLFYRIKLGKLSDHQRNGVSLSVKRQWPFSTRIERRKRKKNLFANKLSTYTFKSTFIYWVHWVCYAMKDSRKLFSYCVICMCHTTHILIHNVDGCLYAWMLFKTIRNWIYYHLKLQFIALLLYHLS